LTYVYYGVAFHVPHSKVSMRCEEQESSPATKVTLQASPCQHKPVYISLPYMPNSDKTSGRIKGRLSTRTCSAAFIKGVRKVASRVVVGTP
jgi:hypothetical protein